MTSPARNNPFAIPNVRLFIAFRVLFNSRFYYPVFTILFLDFGLSIAQFSILNAAWALTIVLAEVPLGALADLIGRKTVLSLAALSMVVEISLICFIPVGNPDLVFAAFLVNRILSGTAEAAASGADEAVAYDSLDRAGLAREWDRVLSLLMRCQSAGFILATIIGAAVYDPDMVNALTSVFWDGAALSQVQTMRLPLFLTLGMALGACVCVSRISDPGKQHRGKKIGPVQALETTLAAGAWILKTPFALSVILYGLLFDSILRVVITLSSQYYRVIQIPESLFGFIGALVAVMGLVIPTFARKLGRTRSPVFCFRFMAVLAVIGLAGMGRFWPAWGLLPAMLAWSAMTFNSFFLSFHLNRIAPPDKRATILSFKGLAFNMAYGLTGTGYALLLKARALEAGPVAAGRNSVFMETFDAFVLLFAAGFLLLSITRRLETPRTPRG